MLWLLPALIQQGLLRTQEVYTFSPDYYYSLDSIVLTLAFMALARIKNPEQLKQCKPGELGRLIGLDRVPEVRCLRKKLKEISEQEKTRQLNNLLIDQWYDDDGDDGDFLYIDGHQRIYYGSKAQLPAKYISRQKLCLSATTEYWVHDLQGMPVMMVMGELTEKLQKAIEDYVIPQLVQTKLLKRKEELDDHTKPQCTFIYDREAYDIPFFKRLWNVYQILEKYPREKESLAKILNEEISQKEESTLINQMIEIHSLLKYEEALNGIKNIVVQLRGGFAMLFSFPGQLIHRYH